QGFRSCMGLVSLTRKYPAERLEAACRRALEIGSPSYRTVKAMLSSGLDQAPVLPAPEAPPQPHHDNVRGPAYFDEEAE
ncbi:MAG: IS21 family transposase, partial [Clostridia bacterium]